MSLWRVIMQIPKHLNLHVGHAKPNGNRMNRRQYMLR
eukprot:COSAG02_NODE_916_length_15971_cov_12.781061_8_plen_37_part_00